MRSISVACILLGFRDIPVMSVIGRVSDWSNVRLKTSAVHQIHTATTAATLLLNAIVRDYRRFT